MVTTLLTVGFVLRLYRNKSLSITIRYALICFLSQRKEENCDKMFFVFFLRSDLFTNRLLFYKKE